MNAGCGSDEERRNQTIVVRKITSGRDEELATSESRLKAD